MIIAIARYVPCAIFVLAMKAITFAIAPIIALPCFVVMREERATTGYPSQFPARVREFLVRPLRLFQTHDDCLDAYWYSGKYKALSWLAERAQHDYDSKAWIRYVCRVAWLWRNPAYGFAHLVGYRQDGVEKVTTVRDESRFWDKGVPCFSLWTALNATGQRAFLIEWQWYFYRQRCLEVVLGYKIPWDGDPANKAMLAVRFSPFKKYPL